MRSSRRKPFRRRRSSAVAEAVAELRRGREALSDIEAQLDRLASQLRTPQPIDAAAPDRLAGSARQAAQALSALSDLNALFA
jgi:hypothetical protein